MVQTQSDQGVVQQERASSRSWRTVDVVVAAVIAVAFGVVFWAWSQFYNFSSPAFSSVPPLQGLMVGMWLVPGVLGGLIIRKPGAALFCELVASIVEMLLGNQWGTTNVIYGVIEGLAPELVFMAFFYRRWNLSVALIAGGAAGVASFCLDWFYSYAAYSSAWLVAYAASVVISAVVIAGLGSWLLMRGLARTGVLSSFASGREQAAI